MVSVKPACFNATCSVSTYTHCVIIAGAGSGIGKAVCQLLAKEGAIITAADKNAQLVAKTVELLPKTSTPHISIPLSVENKGNVENALETVIKTYSKPPTIIVNAAGITRDNFISKLSEEDFMEVLDINLKVC